LENTKIEHGVREACARWSVPLVGGDTTRGPCRTVTLTLGGLAAKPVLRSGGRPGDDLWVAGELGLAAEALLAPAPRSRAMAHLRRPVPLLELGVALGERGLVTAMMDLSDGLAKDLPRLAEASGCGFELGENIPATRGCTRQQALGDGEDYELLLTVSPRRWQAAAAAWSAAFPKLPLGVIGRLTAPGKTTRLAGGWDHFSPTS
jgi:thiamine-monophosphate kinase